MAKRSSIRPQEYPRLHDSPLMDDSKLQQHIYKVPLEELKKIILKAIENANKKASLIILKIPEGLSEVEVQKRYRKAGKELFSYFRQYCGDPASTAYECLDKHYVEIGKEQFRNKMLQRLRMNAGWKYQFIAKGLATASKRFESVSDMGAKETDFNAQINCIDKSKASIGLYVSVKNRVNTMGGQDWPKAIEALENMALGDRNKTGPYLCVFGIAMEHGNRFVKTERGGRAYSVNTEVWKADDFWPFFSNYSYQEIIQAVLEVLQETAKRDPLENIIPDELLSAFGACCEAKELVDVNGNFNDAKKLVDFFVRK